MVSKETYYTSGDIKHTVGNGARTNITTAVALALAVAHDDDFLVVRKKNVLKDLGRFGIFNARRRSIGEGVSDVALKLSALWSEFLATAKGIDAYKLKEPDLSPPRWLRKTRPSAVPSSAL